jgi:hypothetical protein
MPPHCLTSCAGPPALQVPPGQKVKNYHRVYVNDGFTTVSDLTTSVVATAI